MTPVERKGLRFVRRTIPGARETECVIKNSELDALLDLADRYEAALERIAELSYEDRDIDLAQHIAREALSKNERI